MTAPVERSAVDQPQQLEATRLAIVALLAVVTDERFQAVEAALEALSEMSEPARAALEELRALRGHQSATRGVDEPAEPRRAIERHLTMRDKAG